MMVNAIVASAAAVYPAVLIVAAPAGAANNRTAMRLEQRAMAVLGSSSGSGSLAKAQRYSLQACLAAPRDANAWIIRGYIAAQSKRLGDAHNYFMRAMEMAPRNSEVLNNLAVVAWRRKNQRLAAVYFLRAIAANPVVRRTADNVFSFLQRADSAQSAVRLLKRRFVSADAAVEKVMAARGMVRQGSNWISIRQAPVVVYGDRTYERLRQNLEERYAADQAELRQANRAVRRDRDIAAHYAGQLQVAGNDLRNIAEARAAMQSANYAVDAAIQHRNALLADMADLRKQAAALLQSAIGRVYARHMTLILPAAFRRVKSVLPDAPVIPGVHGPTLSPKAFKRSSSLSDNSRSGGFQSVNQSDKADHVGNAAVRSSQGAESPVPAAIAAAETARRGAVNAAQAVFHAARSKCLAAILKNDRREMHALDLATQTAMSDGNVNAVVESQRFLKQIKKDYAICTADSSMANVAAVNVVGAAAVPSVAKILLERSQAVHVVMAAYAAAHAHWRQAVIRADRAEVDQIQSAIKAAMKTRNVQEVVQDAKALKAAKLRLNADATAAAGANGGVTADSNLAQSGGPAVHGSKADRILFILNCSGGGRSAGAEFKNSIGLRIRKLTAKQEFAVIAISTRCRLLGPSARSGSLEPASRRVKHNVIAAIHRIKVDEPKMHPLIYFQRAFKKAFVLHPDAIYFYSDESFDPKLIDVIAKLNTDLKVRIFTIMNVRGGQVNRSQMRKIAANNHGRFILRAR